MTSSARLLIGEVVLEPDPARGKANDYVMDVQMMAIFGDARNRTREEFEELLGRSGFGLTCILPTQAPGSLVEAVPQ